MTFRVAGGGGLTSLTVGVGATVITGGTDNRILFQSAGALAQSANATYDGVSMTLAAGTITTDVAPLRLTETRNAAGTLFKGFTYTVTDTASASGSLLMQILAGNAGTGIGFQVSNTGIIGGRGVGALANYGLLLSGDPATNPSTEYTVRITTLGNIYLLGTGNAINGAWYGVNNGAAWKVDSTAFYGWTNTANDATAILDTIFNRVSAGVVGINTSAAAGFAGRLKLTSAIHAGVAIASLNASQTVGEIQAVTDSLNPVIGSTVAAGGAANALVWWNGANWTVIGK